MKKLVPLVTIGICLIGAGLMWNTLGAGALSLPNDGQGYPVPTNTPAAPVEGIPPVVYQALPSLTVGEAPKQAQLGEAVTDQPVQDDASIQQLQQALRQGDVRFQVANPVPPVQPTNTPAPALGNAQSIISQAPSSLEAGVVPEPAQPATTATDQLMQGDAQIEQALLQHAEAMRQAGVRFSVTNFGTEIVKSASPQSPSAETCRNMLLNPQMDVTEFGDGTGTVDYWTIIAQKIWYSTVYSHLTPYSLMMRDELDGPDTVGIYIGSTYYDYDEFGQAFNAPSNLTYFKVSFSRMYLYPDSQDAVFSRLWTLDNEGYLDEFIAAVQIPDTTPYSPNTWNNFYWELTSAQLITASNKPLVAVFTMFSNQASSGEKMYLDDAQVELCYPIGTNIVYLPLTLRQYGTSPGITCNPYEPDSATQRGSTAVGATCDGSFSGTDTRDYYSLNLNGATNIRLALENLPSGTNWDALIYEDASGYPLACQIGTAGDQNKYKNCTLDASKSYFVMVNAGTAPSKESNTYQMSVKQQ